MMKRSSIEVTHLPHRIEPDPARVIPRFFGMDEAATRRVIHRAMALGDDQVAAIMRDLERDFSPQHTDIRDIWLEHYRRVKDCTPPHARIGNTRKLLIGAYFTMDYAIEAVALFNPSIVPAPQQDELPAGSTRFLMSMRATGEGHISSFASVELRDLLDVLKRG